MKFNKETLKQTVKKGYVKGKTLMVKASDKIFEHSEDIKNTTSILAAELTIAGIYYIVGKNKGRCEGYRKGYDVGYDVGMSKVVDSLNGYVNGMDAETYNTVVEYDKNRHDPMFKCNQK